MDSLNYLFSNAEDSENDDFHLNKTPDLVQNKLSPRNLDDIPSNGCFNNTIFEPSINVSDSIEKGANIDASSDYITNIPFTKQNPIKIPKSPTSNSIFLSDILPSSPDTSDSTSKIKSSFNSHPKVEELLSTDLLHFFPEASTASPPVISLTDFNTLSIFTRSPRESICESNDHMSVTAVFEMGGGDESGEDPLLDFSEFSLPEPARTPDVFSDVFLSLERVAGVGGSTMSFRETVSNGSNGNKGSNVGSSILVGVPADEKTGDDNNNSNNDNSNSNDNNSYSNNNNNNNNNNSINNSNNDKNVGSNTHTADPRDHKITNNIINSYHIGNIENGNIANTPSICVREQVGEYGHNPDLSQQSIQIVVPSGSVTSAVAALPGGDGDGDYDKEKKKRMSIGTDTPDIPEDIFVWEATATITTPLPTSPRTTSSSSSSHGLHLSSPGTGGWSKPEPLLVPEVTRDVGEGLVVEGVDREGLLVEDMLIDQSTATATQMIVIPAVTPSRLPPPLLSAHTRAAAADSGGGVGDVSDVGDDGGYFANCYSVGDGTRLGEINSRAFTSTAATTVLSGPVPRANPAADEGVDTGGYRGVDMGTSLGFESPVFETKISIQTLTQCDTSPSHFEPSMIKASNTDSAQPVTASNESAPTQLAIPPVEPPGGMAGVMGGASMVALLPLLEGRPLHLLSVDEVVGVMDWFTQTLINAVVEKQRTQTLTLLRPQAQQHRDDGDVCGQLLFSSDTSDRIDNNYFNTNNNTNSNDYKYDSNAPAFRRPQPEPQPTTGFPVTSTDILPAVHNKPPVYSQLQPDASPSTTSRVSGAPTAAAVLHTTSPQLAIQSLAPDSSPSPSLNPPESPHREPSSSSRSLSQYGGVVGSPSWVRSMDTVDHPRYQEGGGGHGDDGGATTTATSTNRRAGSVYDNTADGTKPMPAVDRNTTSPRPAVKHSEKAPSYETLATQIKDIPGNYAHKTASERLTSVDDVVVVADFATRFKALSTVFSNKFSYFSENTQAAIQPLSTLLGEITEFVGNDVTRQNLIGSHTYLPSGFLNLLDNVHKSALDNPASEALCVHLLSVLLCLCRNPATQTGPVGAAVSVSGGRSESNHILLAGNGVCQLLVTTSRTFPGSTEVARQVCLLLASFAHYTPFNIQLMACGAGNTVHAVLSQHLLSPEVVLAAFGVVSALAEHPQSCTQLANTDVCVSVVAALRHYADKSDTYIRTTSAPLEEAKSLTSDTENDPKRAVSGVYALALKKEHGILDSFDKHHEGPVAISATVAGSIRTVSTGKLLECGFKAAATLAPNIDHATALNQAGICVAVATSLSSQTTVSEGMVGWACSCLIHLSAVEGNRREVKISGLCEILVTTLLAYSEIPTVAEMLCRCIIAIAQGDIDNMSAFSVAGVHSAVSKTIRESPTPPLIRWACRLLHIFISKQPNPNVERVRHTGLKPVLKSIVDNKDICYEDRVCANAVLTKLSRYSYVRTSMGLYLEGLF